MNNECHQELMKDKYPEMKHPYYKWNGEITDTGDLDE